MRYKQRFFICQLDFPVGEDALALAPSVSTGDIFNAIRISTTESFGDVGMGRITSSLAVKYYSPVTRLFVVRGSFAAESELHAAIALVRTCRKQPVAFRTLQICGSLRVLRQSLRYWHTTATTALRRSLDKDDVELDEAFFGALEAELGDAG
jgi:ribonuclease P/MRP protein subunit POP5